jgi:hypothetical protein
MTPATFPNFSFKKKVLFFLCKTTQKYPRGYKHLADVIFLRFFAACHGTTDHCRAAMPLKPPPLHPIPKKKLMIFQRITTHMCTLRQRDPMLLVVERAAHTTPNTHIHVQASLQQTAVRGERSGVAITCGQRCRRNVTTESQK